VEVCGQPAWLAIHTLNRAQTMFMVLFVLIVVLLLYSFLA
jgi:hypothetical protein